MIEDLPWPHPSRSLAAAAERLQIAARLCGDALLRALHVR